MGLGLGPIGIAAEGLKGLIGVGQLFAGKRILKKTKLPGYDIPTEFNDNIKLATDIKNMGGLSGAEYLKAQNNIGRNANFALNALRDRRSAQAGIGDILQRSNDASLALSAQDAAVRRQNKLVGTQMLTNANSALAGQKVSKMQWERFNPYLRKIQEGQSLIGAGLQNTVGVGNDLAQFEMLSKMPQPNYNYYSK